WDGKEINWAGKMFLKDHYKSFLHIPLNFDKVIVKDMERIEAAGALPPEPLMMVDDKSMWGSDIYIAVGGEVPGAETVRMSGTFLSKVFEGPYQNAGKWAKEMKEHVKSKGKELKKMYSFYTTCPSCAKFYGKNYVVILAEV
ncbi:MAG: hypothetical protein NTU61_04550, partial [Candidatus Altiarchaeota archaeon]|nr:hypothetical protein [Candidatus Altiarchaeota archaeon]